VRVVARGPGPLPKAGTPVRLEVRDVTEVDAPSVVVVAVDSVVELGESDGLATLPTIDLQPLDDIVTAGRELNLWARVAASGAERTASGDWITMHAVPIDPATASGSVIEVEVRRVG
jgi:hypothetical protein